MGEWEGQSLDLLRSMLHIHCVASNGTGKLNFTFMFGCVVHFKVCICNRIPFI